MGNLLLSASLATLLSSAPLDSIVLRSGDRLAVRGPLVVENEVVLFRNVSGLLYSIPLSEVDADATVKASVTDEVSRPEATAKARRRLALSEAERVRLLREIEANHSGKPAPARQLALPELPRQATEQITVSERDDEYYWRERARGYQEAVTRRKEDLAMLLAREQNLQDQILSFLSLGYSPNQFSYQVLQLQDARDSLEQARLEVTRATREYDQFRDDARREGILPGWLR